MRNRTTPDIITELKPNEVFVFGSNLSGRHGKGAAKTAMQWGAKYGQGVGVQGKTYGIPTKGYDLTVLQLWQIRPKVDEFIKWAEYNTGNIFLVTSMGCGLAGYSPEQISPLFSKAVEFDNIYLPESFWQVLTGSK